MKRGFTQTLKARGFSSVVYDYASRRQTFCRVPLETRAYGVACCFGPAALSQLVSEPRVVHGIGHTIKI